jgi:hypothetical protein
MSDKDLEIWQLARNLVTDIHTMTLTKLPEFELYEEGSQIRRSSKSVKSNIVEGYGPRRYKAAGAPARYRGGPRAPGALPPGTAGSRASFRGRSFLFGVEPFRKVSMAVRLCKASSVPVPDNSLDLEQDLALTELSSATDSPAALHVNPNRRPASACPIARRLFAGRQQQVPTSSLWDRKGLRNSTWNAAQSALQ